MGFNHPLTIPDYPKNVMTGKGRVAFRYEWYRYLYVLGRSEMGLVTQLFQEVTLVLLIVDKLGIYSMTVMQILGITVLANVGVYLFGWLWHRFNVDKMRNVVANMRNPHIQEIHDNISNKSKVNKEDGKKES